MNAIQRMITAQMTVTAGGSLLIPRRSLLSGGGFLSRTVGIRSRIGVIIVGDAAGDTAGDTGGDTATPWCRALSLLISSTIVCNVRFKPTLSHDDRAVDQEQISNRSLFQHESTYVSAVMVAAGISG